LPGDISASRPPATGGRDQHGSPVVELRNVGKRYLTRSGVIDAIQDATFSVRDGEFVSLVGPSGCGKSTLLKIIAGLLTYDRGTVQVNGSAARAGRAEVGIMLQSAVLFPWRTVLQNVMLPIEVLHKNRAEGLERAEEILELVGLTRFADKYPRELSGGMQQRVSLSRLLVFDPSLLLMDEPFGALDEFTRLRLNIELASLHERLSRSVVFVTHNISEAVFLSDRVVAMSAHPGRVVRVIDVPLPRPRTQDMVDSPEMAACMREVRHAALGGEAEVPE
jgi:NitT/TauT family transport system ATP-binding protein